AAVTVNPGRRRFPQLTDEPAPLHPPPPARVRPQPPVVRADAGVVALDNGVVGLTLDCRNGFSIRELRNRLAPRTACRLDPTSGLEVRAGGTVLTGRDFETTRVTVEASRVRIELISRRADVPLVLLLTLEIGRGPEVRMGIQARNAGAETLRADMRFPVLKDLVLDAPEHTWIFFPQYRNVLTNEPCFCHQPNHRGFPLQFMDVFQPKRGGGVCLMTRNLEAEPVQYGLAKRASGATAYIQNRGEDFPIEPGATVRLCERVLAVHGGDWHEAVRFYRAWLRTWYRPVSSQDKPWFRGAVWFRSHIASPTNAKNIGHTPPLYDSAARRWRTDEFLAADERLLGLKPDVFHFYVWAFDESTGGDVARDGEYGPKDYANLGGLESFRAAIRHIRRDLGLPVSLYTIWDRYNTDTEFAKKWGDRFAKMRADGQRLISPRKVYISQGVPEWRNHAVRTLGRLETDTETDVLYLDVFGSDDRGRDYNPNAGHAHVPTWVARDDADFLADVRGGLPGRVALWGEFPVTDVGSRYWDGFLMYDCIPLHEYLARAEDVLETAPQWSRQTLPPNVLRFVLPHLRQVVFPVGTEGTVDNWRFLKFLLFNGQALFDTTWRLYDARCRERLGRALRIQRRYMDCFDSDAPEMFVPTERAFVFANRFPGKGRTLWTLFNARYRTVSGAILSVPHVPGVVYRDLWNDRALTPTVRDGRALLSLRLAPQGIGCVLQTAPE
ncbi:MAG: hypothetical protein GXP31_06690, partial [Kiritimatiellaeota bacterium]|nr:hypothetical protein [Kiritimatiellota bacterium]